MVIFGEFSTLTTGFAAADDSCAGEVGVTFGLCEAAALLAGAD
jgi:hypothetical protein